MSLVSTVVGVCLFATALWAGEPQRLTQDGRQKSSPLFVEGGGAIVYVEFTDAKLFQMRRLVLASGTNESLHPAATWAEFEPAWSADGERQACLKLRGVLSVSLLVRDGKGNLLHEIQPDGGFRGYRSPALAPDHSRLVFSYADKATQQIYSSQLNGDDRKLLTESTGINNWTAYSPDGKLIAFGSSRDGNFEIYVMNADGSNPRRLTDNRFQDLRPRFSPDGKQIAFISHRDGNAEIYVMNTDGSAPRRITDNPERDDYAEWHPDGQRLIIVSERGGMQDLYLVELPR